MYYAIFCPILNKDFNNNNNNKNNNNNDHNNNNNNNNTSLFNIYQQRFCFQYHPHSGQLKNVFKALICPCKIPKTYNF